MRLLSFFFLIVSSQVAVAQELVSLKPGLWQREQQTFLNGVEIPIARLSGTECLSEADAQNTVSEYFSEYFSELVAGLNDGEGSTCSLTEPQVGIGKATTDVHCQSPTASTQATIEYRHTFERVEFDVVGVAQIAGASADLKVTGYTAYIGACQ